MFTGVMKRHSLVGHIWVKPAAFNNRTDQLPARLRSPKPSHALGFFHPRFSQLPCIS